MRLRMVTLLAGLAFCCSLLLTGCPFRISGLGAPRPTSVYLGASDRNVYAFDAASGNLRWRQPIGGEVHSTPLVDNDEVIVGATDGKLYSLAGADGHVAWSTQLVPALSAPQYGGAIFTTPVLMQGEVFVASRYQGTIYAVNLFSGKLDGSASIGTETAQWLTRGLDNKTMFVNAENFQTYAFQSLGNPVWTQPSFKLEGALLQGINGVLLGRGGSTFYVFDPANGNQLDGADLRTHIESIATDPDPNIGFNYATITGGGVRGIAPRANPTWTTVPLGATSWLAPRAQWGIFIGSLDGQVASVSHIDGGTMWQLKLDSDLAGPPLIARLDQVKHNTIVAVSKSGHLYGIDPTNGMKIWQQLNTIGGTVDAIPTAEEP